MCAVKHAVLESGGFRVQVSDHTPLSDVCVWNSLSTGALFLSSAERAKSTTKRQL